MHQSGVERSERLINDGVCEIDNFVPRTNRNTKISVCLGDFRVGVLFVFCGIPFHLCCFLRSSFSLMLFFLEFCFVKSAL